MVVLKLLSAIPSSFASPLLAIGSMQETGLFKRERGDPPDRGIYPTPLSAVVGRPSFVSFSSPVLSAWRTVASKLLSVISLSFANTSFDVPPRRLRCSSSASKDDPPDWGLYPAAVFCVLVSRQRGSSSLVQLLSVLTRFPPDSANSCLSLRGFSSGPTPACSYSVSAFNQLVSVFTDLSSTRSSPVLTRSLLRPTRTCPYVVSSSSTSI
ncbi:uncharacterized protein C8Q71DRAFT_557066 [Rhodofomes roseus]|uniref:Secreted protein n=1 Tax=Rhodofomes roseus TaxID=34475 RepID=A0ABQ8KIA6_9APHY|nr:uncharacterized protein C8Q71DRAFT_557066 [Rhodofomes roseus]KAH9837703.1 hypothetical protein C8Q71DRAFT_557066 [Rhodofomes roseus]